MRPLDVGHVDVGLAIEQQPAGRGVTAKRCGHERGRALFVARVDVRSLVDQEPDHVGAARRSSGHERRHAGSILDVRIRAAADQRFDGRRMSLRRRNHQWRGARLIRIVHVGAGRDERFDDVDLALKGRGGERRDARAGREVDVGAFGQRLLDVFERAGQDGTDQRRLGRRVGLVRWLLLWLRASRGASRKCDTDGEGGCEEAYQSHARVQYSPAPGMMPLTRRDLVARMAMAAVAAAVPPFQQSPPARRQVTVGGRRVRTVDAHAHTFVPAVAAAVSGTDLQQSVAGLVERLARHERRAPACDGPAGHRRRGAEYQSLLVRRRPRASRAPDRSPERGLAALCTAQTRTASSRWRPSRCSIPTWPPSSSTTRSAGTGCAACRSAPASNGEELAAPQFDPFWAKAEQLGALDLHPSAGRAAARPAPAGQRLPRPTSSATRSRRRSRCRT